MERIGKGRRKAQTNPNTVVAVFYEDDRVQGAVRNLERLGFEGSQIEVADQPSGADAKADGPEGGVLAAGAASGAMTGAIIGGVFGILLGIGLLPRLSVRVVQDIAIGAGFAIFAGALLGALIGLIAAWKMRREPLPEPTKPGVLVTVAAGARDEEAKSALIESGGDLNPTNAIEASLM